MLRLRAVFTTSLFFFVRLANEKRICLFFQGQGTCALWRGVKIDGEHKRSAPPERPGGTRVQMMGLCF